MEDGSRGSNISLTESEPSLPSKLLNSSHGNSHKTNSNNSVPGNYHPHKYNTRLSAQRSAAFNNTPLKKLYVDLSNSQIEEPSKACQVVAKTWPSFRQRRDSNSSTDSREFDFGIFHRHLPKRLELTNTTMYEVNPCVPRTNWLKYFVLLSLTAVLYVYIQLLHNTEIIKKVHKDLDKLKLNFADSRHKLSNVEGMVFKLKYEQEKMEKRLHNVIAQEIEKFSSDKTGKTDFALESTGGKILQLTPGTENFENGVSVFGIQLCDGKHGPRAMIQADMSPGHCWAIKGTNGGAIIKLLGNVKVDAITLEHISKNLSPTGEISSAPKNFSVWGLRIPTDRGVLLGEFTYNVDGPLVQTFQVANSNYFEFVEFRVLANQGNPDFTCIYRLRVHGSLDKSTGHA